MNFFSKKKIYNRDETKEAGMGSLMQILMNKKSVLVSFGVWPLLFVKRWVCIFGYKTQALGQNKKKLELIEF